MICGDGIGPIQRGIPLVSKPGAKMSPPRAAVEELEPGESRVFSGTPSRVLISHAATIRKRDPSRRYAVRQIGDVVRVWRLA